MAGYARQSSSSIADGETITAAPLNSEFDAVLAAFAFSGGHNHDGSSTEGAYVGILADVDALNKIVVDNANNRHGFFVEVSSSAVEQIRIQDGAIVPVTDSDIDLGTNLLEFKDLYIDGTAYVDTLEIHVGATLSAGVLSLPDGSASAPVITNTSDTNQGLYFSGTDEMSFTAGGTAQVTFADGVIKPVTDNDVDLGTASLQFKDIHINGTANIDTLAGTTMSGNLAMGSNLITGLAAPSADGDAARKVYVDDSIAAAEGLTQLAGNINVNGYFFFGSSGEDIKFKPVGSASILSTQDTDGEFVALVLRNESDAADTTGIASLRFDLEDTGGNTVDAAKIAVKKEASFTATAATQDSSMVFSTSLNGTLTEYLKLTSAGILEPITDDTVDIGTATKEIKNIYVDGTAYIDAIGFGTTSVALPGTDGTANQILKTNGSGTISWANDAGSSFVLEDDDGTEVTISADKEVKFIGSGVTTNWTDTDNGTDADPYDLTFTVDAAQTGITSVVNTSLVVGRDADNDIDFATDNTILFRAGAADQIKLVDGALLPVTDADIDLGSSSLQFKDAFIHGTLEADAITVNGTTLAVTIEDTAGALFSGNTETGITATYQAADNTIDLAINAAQTTVTSLLATDIKIGEDDETKIDFETANEIHLYANNAEQVYVADGIFGPETDSDVDLGTTGVRWKDAFIDTVTTTGALTVGGDLTVNGTTTTVNSTTVTIDDPIFTLGGDSAPGSDDNKDRGIEFRWHNGSAAKVGFFGYDDNAAAFTFIPDATNSSEVFSGTVGNAIFGNVTGTLQTAAQTNITSTGALDGGSITSNFGTIDTGASAITTTGLISGGSLDIDNVLINGTTIGHTDDTDLLTLANGALTVAGTIEGTTITASTAVVPDASGGADLGSTSLEWGDLYIADDKKIYLGSDQNFSIEYDEDGNDTTAVVAAGGVSLAPHGASTGNGTELRFQELAANGANYVGFKSPDAIASNEVWVLPNADGNANQVLKTDGSNALSWVDQAGGGTVSMVADGAITAGKPVVLTSAGKAQQAVKTSTDASSATKGSPQVHTMDNSDTTDKNVSTVFDSTTNHFVMAYKDTSNNSGYGTVVAGKTTRIEKSGQAATGGVDWGTPTVLVSTVLHDMPHVSAGGNAVHVSYRDSSGGGTIKSVSVNELTSAITVGTASYAFASAFAAMSAGPQRIDNGTIGADIASTCYDTNEDRFFTVYKHTNNSSYGTGVVHYISNTSTGAVTWGTPVVFHSGTTRFNTLPACQFDDSTNRVGIIYIDQGNSYYVESLVATVTGGTSNSVSYGSHERVLSGTAQNWSLLYDANIDRFIASGENGSNDRIQARVGYITGGDTNTFAWGTTATISTQNSNGAVSCVDTNNAGKILLLYNNHNSGNKTVGRVMTAVGGTDNTISAGGETTIQSGEYMSGGNMLAFDPANNKFGHAITDTQYSPSSTSYAYFRILTYSGTSISYGSRTQDGYENTGHRADHWVTYAGGTTGQFYWAWRTSTGSTNKTNMDIVSVSGTTPSFEVTNDIMGTDENSWQGLNMLIDPDTNLLSVVYHGYGSSGTTSDGLHHAVVSAPERADPLGYHQSYDTANNYIHLAYSSGTTAYIHPVYYNSSTDAYTGGTPSTLMSGAIATRDSDILFDPDSNRSVVAYRDTSNSDIGTANVIQSTGTAGSPTVTIGSDVTFDGTDDCADVAMTYDTENNKVFICYVNTSDTKFRGTIGTVTAGTNSISFAGTADVLDYSSAPGGHDVSYNTDKGLIHFGFRDADSSNYYKTRVITPGASSFVAGTSDDGVNQANSLSSGSISYGPGFGHVTALAGDGNSNKLQYEHRFYLRTSTTNLTDGNFLGIAAESISDTATGKITIFGGVNENQSGLTVGNHYFSDGGGTVGLNGDNYGEIYLGQAIAADKIKMRKNEGYLYGTATNTISAGDPILVETTGKFTHFSNSTTTVDEENFIGIATKAAAAGEQAEVATAGTVVTMPYTSTSTDLIPGENYYANASSGIIESGSSAIVVGRAINTSQLVVNFQIHAT